MNPLHVIKCLIQVHVYSLIGISYLGYYDLQIRALFPQAQALIIELTLDLKYHFIEVLTLFLQLFHNYMSLSLTL
jgi:hypothetical protein